jgi:hypothetical protein
VAELSPHRWQPTRNRLFEESARRQVRNRRLLDERKALAIEGANLKEQYLAATRQRLREDSGFEDVNAALKEEADAKKRNALLTALNYLDRPAQIGRGTIEEAIWGGGDGLADYDGFLEAIASGVRGEGPDSFATVLKRHGWDDAPLVDWGPLSNISVTDLVGFAVDIGIDSVTFRGAGKGAQVGARAAVKPLRKIPGGVADEGNLVGGKFATLPDPTGEGFKPLALLTRDTLERVPYLGAAPRWAHRQLGTKFVPFWEASRQFALNPKTGKTERLSDMPRYLGGITRFKQAAGIMAARSAREQGKEGRNFAKKTFFNPKGLDDETGKAMFTLFITEEGLGGPIHKAMLRLEEARAMERSVREVGGPRMYNLLAIGSGERSLRKGPLRWTGREVEDADDALLALWKKAEGQGVRQTEALATYIRMYAGEWEPFYRGLAKDLGLVTTLRNYMRQIMDPKGTIAKNMRFQVDDMRMPAGRPRVFETSYAKERKAGKGLTPEQLIEKGVMSNVPMILAWDAGDRLAGTFFHRGMREAGGRFGVRVTPANADDFAKARAREGLEAQRYRFIRTHDTENYEATRESFQSLTKSLKGNEVIYAVPEELAVALKTAFSPQEVTPFLRQYDALQAFWKASVTSIFPAFHARNMFGNLWNSYLLDGLDGRDMTTAWGVASGKVKQVSIRDATGGPTRVVDVNVLMEEMARHGAVNAGRHSLHELRSAFLKGTDLPPQNWLERLTEGVLKDPRSPFKHGRTLGETMENMSKLSHVMTRMRKGDSLMDAINGPNGANRAMFSYDVSTPFMNSVGTRAFPFARWFTQNLPFQFERMLSKPQRFVGLQRFQTLLTQRDFTDAEIALLPSWMFEQMGGIWKDDGEGNLSILTGTGLPAEDLNLLFTQSFGETANNVMQLASPFLRGFIEKATGHSFFTGRDIDDPSFSNYYRRWNSTFDKLPGPVADRLRDWLDYREREISDGRGGTKKVPYVGNPENMYLLTAMFGRFMSTGLKVQSAVEDEVGTMQQVLNLSTGLKISSRDLSQPLSRASITTDSIYEQQGKDWEEAALAHERWVRGAPLAEGLQYTGVEYKAATNRIKASFFAELEATRQENFAQDYMVNQEDRNGIRRKRALLNYARKSLMGEELLPIEIYYSLDPTDPEFEGARGEPDWDEFYARRREALERIRDVAGEEAYERVRRGYFLRRMPEAVQRVEQERQDAFDRLRPFFEMPVYRGTDLETSRRVSQVSKEIRAIAIQWAGQPGATKRARRAYVDATGDIEGVRLLRQAQRRGYNPERARFKRENWEDMNRWLHDVQEFALGSDLSARVESLLT